MLESFVKTIMNSVRQAASNAAGRIRGLTSRPELPTVKIEQRIQALYSRGLEDKSRSCGIREIVVHGTGGGTGSAEQFVEWQLGGELASNWNRGIGLVHYVIGRDGMIIQTIDPALFWLWHSTSYMHDQETVGIELCNQSLANANPYTDEQYAALAGLCDKIMRENQNCRQIESHNWAGMMYSGIGKNCPGGVFDWQRFMNELAARKIKAIRIQTEVLSIA